MADTSAAAVFAVFLILVVGIGATDYKVGDNNGWALAVDYSTWTNGKTFLVGDNLVFNYDSSSHTVYEVSSSDYASCSANALNTDTNSGATTIKLTTPGTHYFICGTQSHCLGGMKMSVSVSSATGAGSPPTTPSPSSNAPPSSSTPPPVTTPNKSSGNSLRVGLTGRSSAMIGGAMVAALGAFLA